MEESVFDLTTPSDNNFQMFENQKEDSLNFNLIFENNQSIDYDNIYQNENHVDIQETVDNTPVEDKKQDKIIIKIEEEPKEIKKDPVEDKKQDTIIIEIEEEPKEIKKELHSFDDSDSILCQNNELKFRTKKRKRNSTEQLPRGRKKAGNFLIDDLIPFHSSNRKDNKKSKIMIMFSNFTNKFLNEYIKAKGNKKRSLNLLLI